MDARNPQRNEFDTIDVEINHPVYGWIPFTADPVDPEGASVYENAVSGLYGEVQPYTAPPPAPPVVPQAVTRRQARQALLMAGRLPDVQPAIDAIADPMQRGMVQIEWDDSQVFERTRPTLLALATAIGMTDEDLDALFTQAAQL